MKSYRIEVTRSAEKRLQGLPRTDQLRVLRAILGLSDSPYPAGCRKLSGYADVFRIRIGHYRVIYSVSERKLIVLVLKIGHQRDVYR